jgi:hypothetical protein
VDGGMDVSMMSVQMAGGSKGVEFTEDAAR